MNVESFEEALYRRRNGRENESLAEHEELKTKLDLLHASWILFYIVWINFQPWNLIWAELEVLKTAMERLTYYCIFGTRIYLIVMRKGLADVNWAVMWHCETSAAAEIHSKA